MRNLNVNIYRLCFVLRSRISVVNQKTDQTVNKMSVTLLGGRCADRQTRVRGIRGYAA